MAEPDDPVYKVEVLIEHDWVANEDGDVLAPAGFDTTRRILQNVARNRTVRPWIGRLAAAAPALVRALLLVEWASEEGCPTCSAGLWIHDSGCDIDEALKAAGFADQASRDAARERMRAK